MIRALIGTGGDHRQAVPDRPEAQETDTELPLQSCAVAVRFEMPLDRIANVGSDVLEVRKSLGIARNPVAVIFDSQIVRAVFPAASDRDGLRVRVDAVLDELGNRF